MQLGFQTIPEPNAQVIETCTEIGFKKVGKVSLKKIFSFPSSFFYSMLIPLDLVHFNFLPSSTSFFGVKNLDRILRIR